MLDAAQKADYQKHFNRENHVGHEDMFLFAPCQVSLPGTGHVYSMSKV